jgi:hypothetical protein
MIDAENPLETLPISSALLIDGDLPTVTPKQIQWFLSRQVNSESVIRLWNLLESKRKKLPELNFNIVEALALRPYSLENANLILKVLPDLTSDSAKVRILHGMVVAQWSNGRTFGGNYQYLTENDQILTRLTDLNDYSEYSEFNFSEILFISNNLKSPLTPIAMVILGKILYRQPELFVTEFHPEKEFSVAGQKKVTKSLGKYVELAESLIPMTMEDRLPLIEKEIGFPLKSNPFRLKCIKALR